MNSQETNNVVYQDEISLKELITVLLKSWKMILIITLVAGAIGAFYGFVIADPVYESKIDGTIQIPETNDSKYGSYPFPSTNKMDYLGFVTSSQVLMKVKEEMELEATLSSLEKQIVISSEEESSRFHFTATGETPEKAKALVESIALHFKEEVSTIYKEKAVNYFLKQYQLNLQSYEESELRITKDLENTLALMETVEPVITLKKLILNDPVYAASLAVERNVNLEELSEEMMLEEVVNPHYMTLEGEVIDLRQQLDDLSFGRDKVKRLILELENEKEDAYGNGEILNVLESQIMISHDATLADAPIAPRKALILAISIVLGGMLAVFIAFFKAYWTD